MKTQSDMKEITYVCAQCRATDTPRFFLSEPVMPVVNCWKCHAGRGIATADQLQQRLGMFPKTA